MSLKFTQIWLTAAALLASVVPAHAASLGNGSFESHGDILSGPDILADLDSMEPVIRMVSPPEWLPGWSLTQGSINYVKDTRWQAADGTFSIDLNGDDSDGIPAPGQIEQTIDTIIGQRYAINFSYAGNPDGSPSNKSFVVMAGSYEDDFQFDATGRTRESMGWVEGTLLFTADDASTRIGFRSITEGNYGPTLDNVRVMAVPEPGTALLSSLGIIALMGASAIKRRNRRR